MNPWSFTDVNVSLHTVGTDQHKLLGMMSLNNISLVHTIYNFNMKPKYT